MNGVIDITGAGTPLQDETTFMAISPVPDPWAEFTKGELTSTGSEQILDRLNSIEVLIRDMHLSSREHYAKGLREILAVERTMMNKVLKTLQLVLQSLEQLKQRHQADPTLLPGILSLVNQSILYLQATSPISGPLVELVQTQVSASPPTGTTSGTSTVSSNVSASTTGKVKN